jgi:hypothetical protein
MIFKFQQNIDETAKINTSLWILKISRKKSANQKSGYFCQTFVISDKKSIGWDMDLKIFRKSIG